MTSYYSFRHLKMHASYTFFQHVHKIFSPKKLQTQASKEKADDEPPPPPFAGLKLKPRKPRQIKPVDEPQQPFKVELKHHEFEKPPQNEEVEMDCSVILTKAFEDKALKLGKKPKVVKKVPKKKEVLLIEIDFIPI